MSDLIEQDETEQPEQLRQATVYRKSQGHYWVNLEGKLLRCAISNRLRKQLLYPTADSSSLHHRVIAVRNIRLVDPVAVGDIVNVVETGEETGLITQVLPRRNKLVRKAAGSKPLEQVIAANLDQVVAVISAARPEPKWELLDRYLTAAESLELPVLICITKMDLVEIELLADEVANYRRLGYAVVLTSIENGEGIVEFKAGLQNQVSVLMGKSGVGKTSLLNAVQPGLGQRVGEVSKLNNKGKHTTTSLEMFGLDEGGSIVDTPGMREFALWEVGERELAYTFREMRPYLGNCKLGAKCSHNHEPGCAVKAAVEAGEITLRRYQSYVHLLLGKE